MQKIKESTAIFLLVVIFFAVIGAFFDVITNQEAVVVLAVSGVPLTILNKLV